jgi:hypothetical protein
MQESEEWLLSQLWHPTYMALQMYCDVIVTHDIPESGLRGDIGTVVERHATAGVSEQGYSVEFFDMTGNTVAMITVPSSALRLPTPADRSADRAFSASAGGLLRSEAVGRP